jgi:gluconate 2-dehydrogenase gamma chain
MSRADLSRRSFLEQSLVGAGAAWLAAAWPDVLMAQQHAHHTMRAIAAGEPAKLEFLTAAQAAEVEAISSLIIPTTDTPGAREAGVVYFIDRALRTFAADQQKPFADGLAAFGAKRQEMFPNSTDFVSLTVAQQTEVLKAMEKTPAFGLFRFATVVGFLCNPESGGNREQVGWKAIGFEPSATNTPPFGYYDAEYVAEQAAARKATKPRPRAAPRVGAKP